MKPLRRAADLSKPKRERESEPAPNLRCRRVKLEQFADEFLPIIRDRISQQSLPEREIPFLRYEHAFLRQRGNGP